MINRITKKRLVGVINLTIKESFGDALRRNITRELYSDEGIGSIVGRSPFLRDRGFDYENRIELIRLEARLIETNLRA